MLNLYPDPSLAATDDYCRPPVYCGTTSPASTALVLRQYRPGQPHAEEVEPAVDVLSAQAVTP
jgi:hypothetical protein